MRCGGEVARRSGFQCRTFRRGIAPGSNNEPSVVPDKANPCFGHTSPTVFYSGELDNLCFRDFLEFCVGHLTELR